MFEKPFFFHIFHIFTFSLILLPHNTKLNGYTIRSMDIFAFETGFKSVIHQSYMWNRVIRHILGRFKVILVTGMNQYRTNKRRIESDFYQKTGGQKFNALTSQCSFQLQNIEITLYTN